MTTTTADFFNGVERITSNRLSMLILLIFALCFVNNNNPNALRTTLSFDDGWDNHYQSSLVLDEFYMKGTYYINSAKVDQPGRLTLEQLHSMNNAGHEIAGHTRTHARLSSLSFNEQEEEICSDRAQLLAWGFDATSFAFPYGADTDQAYQVLVNCGYNSARDSGGLRSNDSCTACPTGESVPPRKPYLMRSVSYKKTLGLDGLKWYVNQAIQEEQTTGETRWVNLVFHEFGDFPDKSQAITEEQLREFLTWLSAIPGGQVETTNEIVGGAALPVLYDVPESGKTPRPYVVFTFDDGTSDHVTVAQMFQNRGMNATFFINTNNVGLNGFMTYTNLQTIQNDGHEIGAHGRGGEHLTSLTKGRQRQELCGAKSDLEQQSIVVVSQAWAYGETDDGLQQMASDCGFLMGRDIGGMKTLDSCQNCPTSLSLPLDGEIMALRSFIVKSYHTLGELMWQIRQAEEENTEQDRALVFTFHQVCDGCAFSPSALSDLLDWLKPRQKIGTSVVSLKTLLESSGPTV